MWSTSSVPVWTMIPLTKTIMVNKLEICSIEETTENIEQFGHCKITFKNGKQITVRLTLSEVIGKIKDKKKEK